MKTGFEDGSRGLMILVIIIILLLFCGSVFLDNFRGKSTGYIDLAVQENIQEVIEMIHEPFADKIERTRKDILLLDRQIDSISRTRSVALKNLEPIIFAIKETEKAQSLAFLDKKCHYRTSDGETGHLDTTFDVVSLFGDRIPMVRSLRWRHGEECFVIVIPVEDFRIDGKTYSAILTAFDPRDIEEIFNTGSFHGEAVSYMIDETGTTLFSSSLLSDWSDNQLSFYRAKGILDDRTLAKIKADIASDTRGNAVVIKNGVETFISYAPFDNGHCIVMEVPADTARSHLKEYGKMIRRTFITLGLILLALFLTLGGMFLIGERNRAVAEEEKKNKEALEKSNKKLLAARMMAEEASMAKSMFLSNMSHDIRTPMNAIIGYTGLALSHLDDRDHLKDYLDKIDKSSNHLLNLINNVLDMSRIESGKTTIEDRPENLSEILSTIESMVHSDISKRGQTLTLDVAGIRDSHVFCDRLHLNQILLNLLTNASKYTPKGGDISLSVVQMQGDRDNYAKYVFVVRDNGIGMSEEFLKTLFDPFSRERNTTVSGIQGTGLGMAIAKNLVEMMGGTIDVKSEKDNGTEVSVTVDLAIDKDFWRSSEYIAPEYDFKGRKILLVEDNELNREIATVILEDEGIIVDSAVDGAIAVEKLAQAGPGDYDVVLMDIQMPIMNGYEATRQIRQLNAPLAGIPIIAMTANAFNEDRKEAFEAGMNEHISKPVDVAVLKKILSSILRPK